MEICLVSCLADGLRFKCLAHMFTHRTELLLDSKFMVGSRQRVRVETMVCLSTPIFALSVHLVVVGCDVFSQGSIVNSVAVFVLIFSWDYPLIGAALTDVRARRRVLKGWSLDFCVENRSYWLIMTASFVETRWCHMEVLNFKMFDTVTKSLVVIP